MDVNSDQAREERRQKRTERMGALAGATPAAAAAPASAPAAPAKPNPLAMVAAINKQIADINRKFAMDIVRAHVNQIQTITKLASGLLTAMAPPTAATPAPAAEPASAPAPAAAQS